MLNIKHKMLKRLTIPRKYKWRRICKDEKKDKEKKARYEKLELAESVVAEKNQRRWSNRKIKWAEPTKVFLQAAQTPRTAERGI